MDILKLVSEYNQESNHSNHIHESRFTQTNESSPNHEKRVGSFLKAILMKLDPMYSGIPETERRFYLQQRVMEMCTEIDEPSYNTYKFHNKKMRSKMIQQNLQNSIQTDVNCLSVLYYLSEYYKRHFVMVLDEGYVNTCCKSYPIQTIYYSKNQYSVIDKDYSHLPQLEIDKINFTMDVKGIPYETGLQAISNYSVKELRQLCESHNLSVKDNSKYKKKQDLYDQLEKWIFCLSIHKNQ